MSIAKLEKNDDNCSSYVDEGVNLLEMCRLCLKKSDDLIGIFENAENISFALRIMACVSLEVQSNDALPKKFCGDCRYQLECTYTFRIKCKNSDSKLRRHLRLINAGKASNVLEEEEEECSDSLKYIKNYEDNRKYQYFGTEKQRRAQEQLRLDDKVKRIHKYDEEHKNLKQEPQDVMIHKIKEEYDRDGEDIPEILGYSTQAMTTDQIETSTVEEHFVVNNLEEQYIITQLNDDVEEMEGYADDNELTEAATFGNKAEDAAVTFMEYTTEDFQIVNDKVRKIFRCSDCPAKFEQKNHLNKHRSVHMEEKGNICDICQKWCPTKSALDRHFRLHTGEKPFKCDVCDRAFNQKSVLKRHLMMHTGVRPYECSMCDKKFIQKLLLRQHFDRKHRPEVVTLHKCPQCPKSFCHSSGLSRHSVVHQDRHFKCTICQHSFDTKNSLKRHASKEHVSAVRAVRASTTP